jgi:hypothetical protein
MIEEDRRCTRPATVLYIDTSPRGRRDLPSCSRHDTRERRKIAYADGWTVLEPGDIAA